MTEDETHGANAERALFLFAPWLECGNTAARYHAINRGFPSTAPSTPSRRAARSATQLPAFLPAPDQIRDCRTDDSARSAIQPAIRRAMRHGGEWPRRRNSNNPAHGGIAPRENKTRATRCAYKARLRQAPRRSGGLQHWRGWGVEARWRAPLRCGARSLPLQATVEQAGARRE